MNKVAGYRKMLGMTQKEMAEEFNISHYSYWRKENGKVPFTDDEKKHFKELLKPNFPTITIDDIFFT